ncbi:MAG: DUF6328 family protein [Nocardioides sp.]
MPRDETDDERADRKWIDLLQELRVVQTGVQLLAGFLLTLPFQERFEDLDDAQRAGYLFLVSLAGVTTALVLSPVALHRRLSGRHVKTQVVEAADRMTWPILASVGLLVIGSTTFVFDVVVNRAAAGIACAAMSSAVLALMVVWPTRALSHFSSADV